MKILGIKIGDARSIAIGAGLVIFAPMAVSALAVVMKPLSKSFIKSGIVLFEKFKVTFAEAKEVLEDLAAEAKAEMAEEVAEKASPTPKKGTAKK